MTFLLAFVLPKAVEVVFSDKPLRSLPNLWPLLEGIVSHPIWTLLIFLGLLSLTGLFWFGSQERNALMPHALSEHDRVRMLRRLRLRYEQMLSQSLQGAVQVELGLVSRPAAVRNAVSLSLHFPNQPEQPLPPHTSIREAYELAQQELLILGEPGTGKSTLLLELAHHLVEKAEQDAEQPLPVLLPLSSWATTRPPLQEWLSEQVALLYDVPRSLSQQWIQTKQLLPLLDGLDEMEGSQRADCIVAINAYHRGHLGHLQPLVVCSRTNEYEMAATRERLVLHTAVVVQPLAAKQVDTHLANMGRPLAALRTALRKNEVLRELATTPLMVQILILTYHDTLVRELSQKEAQLREQIWDDYVQCMVKRKGDAERYPLNETIAWLSWLARQMREHNQAIFYLEQLQPDWLPKRQRAFYRWSIRLLIGLPSGLFFGLLVGLIFGLFGGVVVGLIFGLFGGVVGGLLVGRHTKIKLVETLTWSLKWLLGGLLGGLIFGVVGGLSSGQVGGLIFGVVGGLFSAGGLAAGVSGEQLTDRSMLSPNEGIRRSIKNGLRIWLLTGLPIGMICGLYSWLVTGLIFGLFGGLISGLFGGVVVGLICGLIFGLSATMYHYILRFWLWHTHSFPWKAVSFLEDATTRILLRRIGGGYSFVHRLLLDHFADLNTVPTPASPTPPPALGHPPPPSTPLA